MIFFIFVSAFATDIKIPNIMKYLTDEKLLIVGAGGMIGSNMVQSALMLGLTPNICLYDIYEPFTEQLLTCRTTIACKKGNYDY